jgi:hypothetical protein
MLDDEPCLRSVDPRQRLQLFPRCAVDVNILVARPTLFDPLRHRFRVALNCSRSIRRFFSNLILRSAGHAAPNESSECETAGSKTDSGFHEDLDALRGEAVWRRSVTTTTPSLAGEGAKFAGAGF